MNKWTMKGKVALITGGTKGIGRACAEEFINLGAKVYVTARGEAGINEFNAEFGVKGAVAIKADMSISQDRINTVSLLESEHKSLDILVNNAGTNIRKRTMDYTNDEIASLLDINLISAYEMCRLCYPLLKANESTAIVNISSTAGKSVVRTGSPYAMSKAGLSHLTRYLAVEWAPDGIRVNAIEPWYINTPLTEPVLTNEKAMARILEKTPAGRVGSADEVGSLAAFLAMPAASYISGQCISIDGAASALLF